MTDAVVREIKEELGVDIELIKFLGFTNQIIEAEKQHWVTFNYLAKIISGEPKILEPEKIGEIKWFNLNDLPPNTTQNTVDSAQEYLKPQ